MFILLIGNFTSKDLLVICGVRDNSTLTSIPSQCTAVSASSENMGNIRVLWNSEYFYFSYHNATSEESLH